MCIGESRHPLLGRRVIEAIIGGRRPSHDGFVDLLGVHRPDKDLLAMRAGSCLWCLYSSFIFTARHHSKNAPLE